MKKIAIIYSISMIIVGLSSCSKDCKEHPKKDCYTTHDINPVCGCNGKTYGNPSEANCAGIDNYTYGACQ